MASVDLVPIDDFVLVSGDKGNAASLHLLSLFPSSPSPAGYAPGSRPPAVALRCIRARGTDPPQYGVWTREGGFASVKGVDAKYVTGVLGTCTDGCATGVFARRREGGSGHGGLYFAYLEHDAGALTRLSAKPRLFAAEIAAALRSEGIPQRMFSAPTIVASSVLRQSTPLGPVVAAVIASEGDGEGGEAALLVGQVDSGVWRAWTLGRARHDSLPALFIRPDGASVAVCQCALERAPASLPVSALAPSPTAALQVFERVGEMVQETITSASPPDDDGSAGDGTAPPPRATRVAIRERTIRVQDATPSPQQALRAFASRPFVVPPNVTAQLPLMLPMSLEEQQQHSQSTSPLFSVALPPLTGPVGAAAAALYVLYNPTHTALVGSYHEVPNALAPISVAVAELGADSDVLCDRPHGALVAFALCEQNRSSVLHAFELFRSSTGPSTITNLHVSIGTNASLGVPANRVMFQPPPPSTAQKGSPTALRIPKLFTKRRAAVVAGEVGGGVPSSALLRELALKSVVGEGGAMYLCAANGRSAALLRVCKAVLGPEAPSSSLLDTEGVAGRRRDGAPLVPGEELRFAMDAVAQIPREGPAEERAAAVDRVVQRVLPALRHVGSAQKDVYLVQRALSGLLDAYRPATREEWQHAWAAVTAVQAALADRTCSDGQLVFTDQFCLDLAHAYVHRHAASSSSASGEDDSERAVRESLRQVVSQEMRSLAEASARTQTASAATMFVLDALASRTALVPLAEEVVRRFVETSTLSNGACTVRPKHGTGSCVHVLGALLLASCLDVDVSVTQDAEGELRCCCYCLEESPEIGDSQPAVLVHVPVQAFRTQKEFDHALALAADMLCVLEEATTAAEEDVSRQLTHRLRHLTLPLLSLSVARRTHCLAAFFSLFAPLLNSAIAECATGASTPPGGASSTGLSNNAEWITGATRALARSFDEQARHVLQVPPTASPAVLVTETLCYVLSGGGAALDATVLSSAAAVLSQELCVSSVILFLVSSTERLVAAQNKFCVAAARASLVVRAEDRQRALRSVDELSRRLLSTLRRSLGAWGQAQLLLPYRLPDVVASYAAEVATSVHQRGGRPSDDAASNGTILSRSLVVCFRLLVLVYYAHQLVQRMDKAVELCRKAAATGDELSEFHPAVDGSLQALYILHTLGDDCVPQEWLRAKLLVMVETVLPRLTQPRSAPWAPFLAHVLELSSVGDTAQATTKKRYFALLDALRSTEPLRDGDESARLTTSTYVAKADRLVSSLVVQKEVPDPQSEQQPRRPQPLFALSHARDPSTPAWVGSSHTLASHKYLIQTEWTERLWAMERMQEPFREATDLVVTRLLTEREKAEKDAVKAATDNAALPPELQRPLFSFLCETAPPSRTHAIVASSLPPPPPAEDGLSVPQRAPAHTSTNHHRPSGALPQDSPAAADEKGATVTPPVPAPPAAATPAPAQLPRAASPPPSPRLGHAEREVPTVSAAEASAALGVEASKGGKYNARDVAWWEALLPSSPESGKQRDGEEPAALSDTDTSYTTATSRSTLAAADEDGPRRCSPTARRTTQPRPSSPSSPTPFGLRHCRRADDEARKGEDQRETKQCRCRRQRHGHCSNSHHCHRHHRHCARPGRESWERAEPESPFVLDTHAQTAFAMQGRPQLLQLGAGRGLPSEAAAARARPATSQGAGSRCSAHAAERGKAQDTNGEIALLSLSRTGTSAPRRRSHHVQLFGASAKDEDVAEPLAPADHVLLRDGQVSSCPFSSATARMSVRYLEPPPLPPASVFHAPPPLLRLPTRGVAKEEEGWRQGGDDGVPTAPTLTTGPDANTTTAQQQPQGHAPVFQSPWEANPYAQVPREPIVAEPAAQSAAATPHPSAVAAGMAGPTPPPPSPSPSLPVPEVKRSILSPSELSDFRRYTDELKSRGTATFLPVPVPIASGGGAAGGPSGRAVSVLPGEAAMASLTPTAAAAAAAGLPDYTSLLEQHHSFLQRVEQTLHKHDTDSAQFHQRLMDAIQRGSLGDPQRPPGGLSSVEQARLVQNTIKQKNDLMSMNQQLLDIQLRATRSSVGAPAATTTSDNAAITGQSSFPAASLLTPATVPPVTAPVPPPVPTVATTMTQTSPVPVRDAALDAHAAVAPAAPSALTPPPRPVDERAAKSFTASMADLDRLSAELLSMNASAGAMERAIAETRDVIAKYEACRNMDAANAEGAALMASLRHKTEAAERRLAELTAASGKQLTTTPWSTLHRSSSAHDDQPHRSTFLSQSTRGRGVEEGKEEGKERAATVSKGNASRSPAEVKHPTRQSPQLPQPLATTVPPQPRAETARMQVQSHHSGPIAVQHSHHPERTRPAVFLTGASPPSAADSVSHQQYSRHGPSAPPPERVTAPLPSSPPPVPVSSWDPSKKPAHQPLSVARRLPTQASAQPPAQRAHSVAEPQDRITDLGQLYESSRRHHPSGRVATARSGSAATGRSPPRQTSSQSQSRGGGAGGDRFVMYRAPSAPRRHRVAASVTATCRPRSPEPQQPWPTFALPAALTQQPRPRQPLEHSASHQFEARQQRRRSDNIAQRMERLEAELFG